MIGASPCPPCPLCHGTGMDYDDSLGICPECGGSGEREANPILEFLQTMTDAERAIVDDAAELDRRFGGDADAEQRGQAGAAAPETVDNGAEVMG